MSRTAIQNALIFDGERISGPRTIIIDESKISHDTEAKATDTVVDGTGCTLLPGLIDCHVHIKNVQQLASCAAYGVTTVCDMACWPREKYHELHSAGGPTTWLGAGLPAFAPDSVHGKLMRFAGVGIDQAVQTTADASRFVSDRVKDNVDYVKVIADVPGIEQEVLDKIQEEAQTQGKMTVAHTAQYGAFVRGLHARFDILTHTPMDKAVDRPIVDTMISQGTIAVPTLTMMERMSTSWMMQLLRGRMNFQNAMDSVAAMHEAGVPILVGTDTNSTPGMSVEHGSSLHHEMELLVRAGLSPTDVLQSATALPARYFHLEDRGKIEPGRRADLLLVRGDPVRDITATRCIVAVWSDGVALELPSETSGCSLM